MAQIDPTSPYQAEIVGLDRQRKLAQMLLKQGMDQNNMQGQMVSGRYVGASPWQGIANLAQIWAGKSIGEEADVEQGKIAERLRNLGKQEVNAIINRAKGTEELAGPAYQGVAPSIQYPEGKANTDAALAMAAGAQTPEGRAFAAPLMANFIPKEITPYEKEKLRLEEEALKLQRANAGRVNMTPFESSNGMVFNYNPRTGQYTQALDASGKPIMGKANALTEAQGKATTFQGTMMNAAKNMKELEDKGYNPASFKSQAQLSAPSMGNVAIPVQSQQYKQAMDNFANAYLRFQSGANMSEAEISRNLREMMPVFGDKPELIKQKADARDQAIRLMGFSAGPGAQMNAVANPSLTPTAPPQASAAPAKPAQAEAPQTAWMGNRKIVVRGNGWVYEDNGQAVK